MQKKCSTCTHSIVNRHKSRVERPCADCVHLDEWEPMTNADAIRAMSDEELAKLLLEACRGSKCGEQPLNEYGSIDCFRCRLTWLQQPKEA